MKILYACTERASDPLLWSGTVRNCRLGLEQAGATVEVFDQIPFECPWRLRVLHQGYKTLSNKTHYLQVEPAILRRSAERIAQRFISTNCDAIFCPGTGIPTYGYISPSFPVFSYLDATKYSWIDSYFGITTLTERSRKQVDQVDRTGLANNNTTIFSSEWALVQAAKRYGVKEDRLAMVPFGANLTTAPSNHDVVQWVNERNGGPLRCVFLGKEWIRKGGPDALATIREIRTLGIDATLDIVGCSPNLPLSDLPFCRIHGFVDHSTAAGGAKFRELLRNSHFILFLSQAEAFGIALCEAAAYGVPSYAATVGGIPTVVKHNETGWLSALPFSAQDAAIELMAAWSDRVRYKQLAMAARADFETRLNWTNAGKALLQCVEAGLERQIRK